MEKNFQAFPFFLKMSPPSQQGIPLQQCVMEDVENRWLTEDYASLGRAQSDTAQEAARGNGTASCAQGAGDAAGMGCARGTAPHQPVDEKPQAAYHAVDWKAWLRSPYQHRAAWVV